MFNQIFTLLLPLLMAVLCYSLTGLAYHNLALILPLSIGLLQFKFFSARWKLSHYLVLLVVVAINVVLHEVWIQSGLLSYAGSYQITGIAIWSVIPALAFVFLLHDVMFVSQAKRNVQCVFGGVISGCACVFAWLVEAVVINILVLPVTILLGAIAAPVLLKLFAHKPSKRSPLKAS